MRLWVVMTVLAVVGPGCRGKPAPKGSATKGKRSPSAPIMQARLDAAAPRPKVDRCAQWVQACHRPAVGDPVGWARADAAYKAMLAGKHQRCLCLAKLAAADKTLGKHVRGAASFNLGRCLEQLKCPRRARAAFDAAVTNAVAGKPGFLIRCNACHQAGGTCDPCGAAPPKRTWPVPYGLWLGMSKTLARAILRKLAFPITHADSIAVRFRPVDLFGEDVLEATLKLDGGRLKTLFVSIYTHNGKRGFSTSAWTAAQLQRRFSKPFRTRGYAREEIHSATVKGVLIEASEGGWAGWISFGRPKPEVGRKRVPKPKPFRAW